MALTLFDQLGTTHTFASTPLRIVSLVPSLTELLYDLGLENRIVGITKFCVHPYHLKSTKAIIGGTKKVNFKKIQLLQPDIIIANKEENTREIVEQLSAIAPVWVTDIISIADNQKTISDFAAIFNCRTQATNLSDKINFAHRDFEKFIAEMPQKKVAYFIWREPYMVAGSNNYINSMLHLNRFVNIYEDKGRYPEIEIRKIRLEGDPDLVFLSSEPYPFKEEHAFEIGRFTHHAKTVFVDGEMFSWYGSRILKAFSYFKQLHKRIQ